MNDFKSFCRFIDDCFSILFGNFIPLFQVNQHHLIQSLLADPEALGVPEVQSEAYDIVQV